VISREQLLALGVLWVGGWAFLCFDYPRLVCRVLQIKNPTDKRLRMMRKMGAVFLIWTFASLLITFVSGFFMR
jgi:hypothetical protein